MYLLDRPEGRSHLITSSTSFIRSTSSWPSTILFSHNYLWSILTILPISSMQGIEGCLGALHGRHLEVLVELLEWIDYTEFIHQGCFLRSVFSGRGPFSGRFEPGFL
jgi:hypothetical protein